MLRDYQQRSIDLLYDWLSSNSGNPCLELPTGSGKSHIIAALCKDILQNWPEQQILMLTHVRELIEQNAEKMLQHWPGAPLGIYSAGLKMKQIGEPITFGGIQSLRNKADFLGHQDLIIIDECHLVNHKQEGGYRKLIDDLTQINPHLRVIGLTATPYRLGHGYITDKPALFDEIIKPVTIEELIFKGYLSSLRSKQPVFKLSVDGVKKRGGEYIEKDLQEAVDTRSNNEKAIDETIKRAEDRKAWLLFCAGVDHAMHVKEMLIEKGITAECITGKTPLKQRDKILEAFKAGEIKALTNANVLTTGFDYPDIDLVVFLRPTLSTSLYVQMAGRGMRIKSHTDHCLVLDFAGNIERHGPITNIIPPTKKGDGVAPVKVCDACDELCALSAKECPACGNPFPEPKKKDESFLRNDDIMGLEANEMEVTKWFWRPHTGRGSGKEMIKVTYYGALTETPIDEYFCITHEGYAGNKAIHALTIICTNAGAESGCLNKDNMQEIADTINQTSTPPDFVNYRKDGKFYRVLSRHWSNEEKEHVA